jgi:signal transduction histidine kinase
VRSARIIDPLLAVTLCVWALVDSGPDRAFEVPAAILMTLPLAFRHRAPLLVAVLVAIGFALLGLADNASESLATLAAALIATYSAALVPDRRRALAGVGVLIAGGLVETALVGDNDYGFTVVTLGIAGVAGAAMSARTRQADAERERAEERAVAAERERIARELHDSVAHAVSLMVVQAGAAETTLHDDSDAAKALERIRATGHEAVADLGRMVGLLRSEGVQPVVGIANAERLVAPFREAGLAVDLNVRGTIRELPAGVDSAAYRIAQEALTNAVKHGDGSATITIAYEPDALRLMVTNPLGGTAAPGSGHGIAGMRERVRLYGGELHAGQNGRARWHVEVRLPLPPE